MRGTLPPEQLAQLADVLAHWDIPPVRAVEPLHDAHLVFKVTTAGQTFALKDISDAPYLLRGYQSLRPLTDAEVAALPYAMLTYHLLLANWFLGLPRLEPIGLEVQALD